MTNKNSNKSVSWQDALQGLLDGGSVPSAETEPETTAQQPEQTVRKGVRLDIELDRKGRAGKQATIISGFGEHFTDDEVAQVASTLKKRLATGGSARGGEILVQGDRRADCARVLTDLGFKNRII